MASTKLDETRPAASRVRTAEAPITLDQPAAKALGFFDQVGLWGNLGVSLLGFTGALVVLQPFGEGTPELPLAAALIATVIGTAMGSIAIGLAAVPGARTGAPAMVLLRGLFGARVSYLPTGLNILQLLGWGIFEIVTIASAAHQLAPGMPGWGYKLIAGLVTTVLALRPLGVVRVLRKYVTGAVVVVMVYLFVQLLRHPLPSVSHPSWHGFWPAVDTTLAVAISWVPVAADYTRHSKSPRTAFAAAFVGYTITQVACYALGLIAILTVATDGATNHIWGAFIAVPLGTLAFAVLAIREIDQSFCNVYSTAVSVQNLRPRWDRRVLALVIGTAATVLALVIDINNYSSFLSLIGSVFVPLFAVLVVDYFAFGGARSWNLSQQAPARWAMLVPWLAGFVVYQLIYPGGVSWWATMWGDIAREIHFTAQTWMSASLLSFVVAAALTLLVRLASRRPAKGER
ncbi:MAG: nucleobase:cation symporter, family [Actinomycetota bacterium]|jgi:putative hydroxymethylpyrimidine transporter CytX|nr:nucleobase:cation symporter, family [Actinomycetota bacterium]